jgi:predicted CXXCH cytochrome family protein
LRIKTLWAITSFLLLCAALNFAIAQKQPASNQNFTVAWKAPAGNPQDFIGADTCVACHADHGTQFSKTVHATAAPAGVMAGTGCESCHGPGKAHAEAMAEAATDNDKIEAARKLIFSFNGKPAENSGRCLTCHATSQDQMQFDRSEHHFNGVACQTCHSAHLVQAASNPRVSETPLPQRHFFTMPRRTDEVRWLSSNLLRRTQPELCGSCHGTVQAQFSLPSHHRVPEGLMKCTDCHSPHGTRNKPMLQRTNWEGCTNCHNEKRGPFVHEHAAVKIEGCTGCHTPHGSVSRNLLLRREGRFMCLQCHVNPQAPNVPHGRLGFATRGECVRCHVTIHGSNSSEFFLN